MSFLGQNLHTSDFSSTTKNLNFGLQLCGDTFQSLPGQSIYIKQENLVKVMTIAREQSQVDQTLAQKWQSLIGTLQVQATLIPCREAQSEANPMSLVSVLEPNLRLTQRTHTIISNSQDSTTVLVSTGKLNSRCSLRTSLIPLLALHRCFTKGLGSPPR